MKRRNFIMSLMLIGLSGDLLNPEKLDRIAASSESNRIKLKSFSSTHAQNGNVLELPTNPNHGDYLQIIVNEQSLRNPSRVVSLSSSIVENYEAIELDQLSIIRLVFDKPSNNWFMG